jgi:hypothetical protein
MLRFTLVLPIAAALTALAYLASPALLHRDLTLLDACALNAIALIPITWARRRYRLRVRMRQESMRDSALW